MRTSEPSTQQSLRPNETYSATERVEEVASEVGLAGALTIRAVEIGALVLIGLLVSPPLFILVVVVVVPLVAVAIVVLLAATVVAAPVVAVHGIRALGRRRAASKSRSHVAAVHAATSPLVPPRQQTSIIGG